MYKEMRKEAADTLREHKAKAQKERKKWGHEYVLYNNSVSYFQAESYWFVYWRWWKTHFMDSNKPLCLLNTQINYRLGNQNCNLFSLLWTQTHNSASADDKQMNLCVGVFFRV